MNLKETLDEPQTITLCAHCALPCEQEAIVDSGNTFCCMGCAAVYQLLQDKQLCKYYEQGSGLSPIAIDAGAYDFLDKVETRDEFTVFKQGNTIEFKFTIPGMHCNACIYLLERLDKFNASIQSSQVDFFKKELHVTAEITPRILSETVELLCHLGYKPDLTLSKHQVEKKGKWNSRVIKIGIAGFCFGNIMMLSFPEYLGLSSDASSVALKPWFDGIALFLSLPVLFYCSLEFFENSFKAIRSKTLSIDIPVSIAILATFGRSLYELFVNGGTPYFDSMTGIVFLLLTGRYFQDLTFDALSFDRDYKSYFPLAARKIAEGKSAVVNINELVKEDIIELRNTEMLPADAVLVSELTTLDYSFITGESKPTPIQKGEKVYAGAVVIGQMSRFQLLENTDNSRLVKRWATEGLKSKEDNSLTEKINYYFSFGLILVSSFAFLYQYQINGFEEAFKALTSVLIVACPCILLLASTFANGHLLRTLKKYGMFVKSKATITQLLKTDTLVFDKTGTLTDNSVFEIIHHHTLNKTELLQVSTVCYQSIHPYSRAISKTFPSQQSQALEAFVEYTGKGCQAIVNGTEIKLGSASFLGLKGYQKQNNNAEVHVEINKIYRGRFELKQSMHLNVSSVMKRLHIDHYDLYLSSGDTVLNEGIDEALFSRVYLTQNPEDKVNLVKNLQEAGKTVCFAGDGLNDSLAMRAADVSVAVADNENAFFPACDIMLSTRAIRLFPDLLNFIKSAQWVIIISFAFSLVYNVIGLYFAITAQLSPLTAAILMPTSSVTMLFLCWGLTAYFARKAMGNSNFQL